MVESRKHSPEAGKMDDKRIDDYCSKIRPLYGDMAKNKCVKDIHGKKGLGFFCTQWGTSFNQGILFVGRATNGWSYGIDPAQFDFDPANPEKLFAPTNQMELFKTHWSKRKSYEGDDCRCAFNRSAFWRVVRRVAETCYQDKDDWYKHIAWTNLSRCAPYSGGNPSNKLWRETLEQNRQLLKVDLEVLDPKIVLFITGGWENDFLESIVGTEPCAAFSANGRAVKTWTCGGRLAIACERPEGRPEDSLVACICGAINSNPISVKSIKPY